MSHKGNYFEAHAGTWTLLAMAMAVFMMNSSSAWASVIVSVQSVTVAPGSSGDAFDILLTNSGPSSINVGAFSFGISTAYSLIDFTDANTSTAVPYILTGDSLFGPDLTGAVSGQSLITSDVALQPLSGATLVSGTTVGLAHILFSVGANASPGSYAVDLTPFPATSLSDFSGNAINIDTLSAGQITITGASSVPEPSSIFLFLSVLPIALVIPKLNWRGFQTSRTAPAEHLFCAPHRRLPTRARPW